MLNTTDKVKREYDARAADYERDTRGVSRSIARHVIGLAPAITSVSTVHDNACGPGILTEEILASLRNGDATPSIQATDLSDAMISLVQQKIAARGWSNVHASVMDAQDMSAIEDATFTHSFTNFGIFFLPDPHRGASEIYRTLKPGGIAILTVWKRNQPMDICRAAQSAIRPDLPCVSPVDDKWMEEATLRDLLEKSGFREGEIEVMDCKDAMVFPSLEEMVQVFSGGFFTRVMDGWAEADRAKWNETIRGLLRERTVGNRLEMFAWVGVAKKAAQ